MHLLICRLCVCKYGVKCDSYIFAVAVFVLNLIVLLFMNFLLEIPCIVFQSICVCVCVCVCL